MIVMRYGFNSCCGILACEKPGGKERHRASGRALLLAFLPRGAGDVEVRPVVLLGEARQKARRRDAAARAASDVGEIGEVAGERVLVVLPQRQLPCTIVRVVAGGEQRAG